MTATLDTLKTSFQLTLNAENKSSRTVKYCDAGLDRLISRLPDGGTTKVRTITTDKLRAWMIDLRQAGMLPSSVSTRYRAVQSLFESAELEGDMS